MSTSSATQFKNDHLTVRVEQQPGCQVSLDIEVSPTAVEASYQKAFKNVNKEVSLPGFRRGRAPDSLVHQHYASDIEREWKRLTAQTALSEALSLAKIDPYTEPSEGTRIKRISRQEGAEVIAHFERVPQVPAVDLQALQKEPLSIAPVTEAQIAEKLEELQRFHATWQTVEGRPVQPGDQAILDVDRLTEQGAVEVYRDTPFEVGSPAEIGGASWLSKALVGHSTGERVEATGADTEGHSEKYSLHIKEIRAICLPPVDDALARKAGCQDVAQLKERVATKAQTEAEAAARDLSAEKLADQLLQLYVFEVPQTFVRYEQWMRIKAQRELRSESSDKFDAKDFEEESTRSAAERFIRLLYLLRDTVEKYQIGVTQRDYSSEVFRQRFSQSPQERYLSEALPQEERQMRVQRAVAVRKALHKLLELITP